MTAAWKDLERRICAALGGRRAGPIGASVSDCVNVPFAVEIKRSSRAGPPVLARWIQQARFNGQQEKKPWALVVAGHNDRRPVVCLDFLAFAQLAQEAGRIPTPLPVEPPDEKPAENDDPDPGSTDLRPPRPRQPPPPRRPDPQPPPPGRRNAVRDQR